MRNLLKPLIPMAVAVLVMVAPAGAHQVPHHSHLTKNQKVAFYKKVITHDRQQITKANHVFRFFEHHSRLLASADSKSVAWHEVKKWRALKREHTAQMKFAQRRLAILQPPPPQFAHLALWRCIAGYPGARPGGGSGESGGWTGADNGSHYNILQMTNPWYGINPIGMSAEAIMATAEAEYALHHNSAWLSGQWGQTIGPCWAFA